MERIMGRNGSLLLTAVLIIILDVLLAPVGANLWTRHNSNAYQTRRRSGPSNRCPKVGAIKNFDLERMMGCWHVVQYYASTEELPEYACMRSHFSFSKEDQHITMNFSYIFAEDPLREKLVGNITWMIPKFQEPGHWQHTEDIYEGIYNTYVLDTDYDTWGLVMHCAEKKKQPRYLSALLLSRKTSLADNEISFLRGKLPQDIDTSFMFNIGQESCDNLMESSRDDPLAYVVNGRKRAKEIFKIINKPDGRVRASSEARSYEQSEKL
uniref:Karl, isoform A n=2 Tax=Drosophila melanogaster TaxID=7227 RepID=Q9VYU5_DROME|eukprot:NP_001285137.1 karl, isoform C [Drosophila melanogaster]